MTKLKFNATTVHVVYCIKHGNRDEIEKKNLKVAGNILKQLRHAQKTTETINDKYKNKYINK